MLCPFSRQLPIPRGFKRLSSGLVQTENKLLLKSRYITTYANLTNQGINTYVSNLSKNSLTINYTPIREKHGLPFNSIIVSVPQQEAWIVERMGKFNKILEPGLNVLFPFVDSIRYVQRLKEMAYEIPKQTAVTSDYVTLTIDGLLHLQVVDPYKASYSIENPEFSVIQLAQTTMRSEIGKVNLDSVFKERESLNNTIASVVNKVTSPWGITSLRYEIRDINLPAEVQHAMQLQVEAERKKKAQILESEGAKEAEVNIASGQASAIMTKARAKMEALNTITSSCPSMKNANISLKIKL